MFNYRNKLYMKRRPYFFLLIIPLIFGGLALIVMLLWNAIMPAVLHVETLTYWQALGLLVLCRILFGGFLFGGRKSRPSFGGPSSQVREKWMNMSDEERMRFKEEWRKRCGKP
jgi:hypothetical protein